jgi:anthranilate 1,2-dioxygenase small subunit/terephthalate 1,2-dioxygenase oxygenase component beta subunit
MGDAETLFRLAGLNAAYAAAIDADRLEAWPDFFLDRGVYKVTTAENHARGHPAGVIYAEGKGMLIDRVSALRRANIYERQRYRHVVGMPVLTGQADGLILAETGFVIVRTMRDGRMNLFAAGTYMDRVGAASDGTLRFAERIVVCDSQRFDTLVAIPL